LRAICRTLSGSEEETVRAFVHDAGYAVLPGAVPERIAYREAQNRGRAITETATKITARTDTLFDALIERISIEQKRASRAQKRVERR
jgi:chromosome partitioning protein